MMALLLSPLGKAVGGVLVAGALIGGVYIKGRSDGREAVLSRLASDRITILKDGKEIDDEVLRADDDMLCDLLGGCGVPDQAAGD